MGRNGLGWDEMGRDGNEMEMEQLWRLDGMGQYGTRWKGM